MEQKNMLQLQTESRIVTAPHKGKVHKKKASHADLRVNHSNKYSGGEKATIIDAKR